MNPYAIEDASKDPRSDSGDKDKDSSQSSSAPKLEDAEVIPKNEAGCVPPREDTPTPSPIRRSPNKKAMMMDRSMRDFLNPACMLEEKEEEDTVSQDGGTIDNSVIERSAKEDCIKRGKRDLQRRLFGARWRNP